MNNQVYDTKAATNKAEWEFYDYCASRVMSPESVLSNMTNRPRNESFWKFAKKRAEIAFYNYINQ